MEEMRQSRRPVEGEGLVGTLFFPSTPGPHPAIITLGGAGGGLSEGGARTLASEGYAALALAYFGLDPLPRELVEIPLEYFGRAIEWLQAQSEVDATRLAVVGNSKGAELDLLLGATYPKDIKAVVGYAPSAVVWQGIPFNREAHYGGPRSSWSLGGKPVPFVGLARPYPSEMAAMAESSVEGRQFTTRAFYGRALEDQVAVDTASIPVERIDGPVMLISGTDDRLWPSTRMGEMVIERLRAHEHPFAYEHLRYEGAGHMITLPGYEPESSWTQRYELGGNREADEFANADSWLKVLDFLGEHLRPGSG